MTLLDHLKQTGETVDGFADRAGIARNTLRKIAYGQRQPSLDMAVRISEATSGAVRESAMLLPDARPTTSEIAA